MGKKIVSKDQIYLTVVANTFVAIIAAAFGGLHESFVVNKGTTKRTFALLWTIICLVLFVFLMGLAYAVGSYAIDSGSILAYIGTMVLIIFSLKFLLTSGRGWKAL